ncbi:vacuolar membrane-associated protein iml1 [Monascus purpureus]|uniref:Vacuolar membrane-associated protein IML1 n=1 Tax=Monascus purpureus TaxID=5098 RepID=A0A507QSK2_MONPU|nr:vacuolar membrane-associated protein iml1 [Monascus purpureus]BDD55773.1 vacuolar membrane-associated protein iml1 [Monascus purpureus]
MALRGPSKPSHLRQVSAASLESLSTYRSSGTFHHHHNNNNTINIPSNNHDSGQVSDGRSTPLSFQMGLNNRLCSLWVHDEAFCREEILFNQAVFSDSGIKFGDVVEILPVRAPNDVTGLGERPKRDSYLGDSTSSMSGPGSGGGGVVSGSGTIGIGAGADGRSKFKTPLQSRCLFVVKPLPQDIKARHPRLEISVTSSVANIFGFKNRSQVLLSAVDRAQCAASHIEISFRDQFLVRSDMWRLVTSELVDKIVYKGQKILFMGSIRATVKNIFIRGKKVLSGYFSPHTIPVFRSESAKYVLFIQMSREMWDFDSEGTGDILFSRMINGFLPELFKRWANIDAQHLVTIVLFTRVEYDTSSGIGLATLSSENLKTISSQNQVPTRDFYRVVVNDMPSGHWTAILDELKKDFRTFLRDVSILKTEDADTPTIMGSKSPSKPQTAAIVGRPSTALRGNILEAIHLASSHLSFDHIDRDMVRTGTSIIVITPGSGVFEVSYESLASTTEALTNRGIAIDLVCLSPMPLHSVPLFKYRDPVQRPSTSSTYSDPNSGPSSPELRHSRSSLTSRSSHPSSLSTPYGSLSVGSGPRDRMPNRPKEWNYGIPHWLDISYWNPETYREARRILKQDPNAPIPFTVTKPFKVFVPRVRMYEIQMMGVMESEQSNISIPYLLEGQGVHRLSGSGRSISHNLASNKSSFKHGSSYKAPFSDSLRPEPFLPNMPHPRDMIPSGHKKQQKAILACMDQYDHSVFRRFPKPGRPPRGPKLNRPSEPEVQSSGAHERISARSISKLREHEDNSKKSPPRKPALKMAKKPSAISRTISFALRGLGTMPPRAQASTKLNVEHAVPVLPQTTSASASGSIIGDKKTAPSICSSDTASLSTVVDLSSRPGTPQKHSQEGSITPSRPISIKAKKPLDDPESSDRGAIPDSFSTAATAIPFNDAARSIDSRARRPLALKFEVPTLTRDGSARDSPRKALSPWVRSINPCNTSKAVLRDASWFGRWQHAYPRPPHIAVVKWKSLKSPAVLPLTTEEFPTASELASDYLQTPYRVFPNDDADGVEALKTRDMLLRSMISLRLARGFQMVTGKNVAEVSGQSALESLNIFDRRDLERDGTTMFLSKGNEIHRLVCLDGEGIEVTRFTHRTSMIWPSEEKKNDPELYTPFMRTILSKEYTIRELHLGSTVDEYNWNYADNYIAGHRDYLMNPAQQLHFWRVRYVLIPMRLSVSSRHHPQSSYNEDNEEEIHLLGISQLTHIWQRHKYVPPEEKRVDTSSRRKRIENPLNIMYQTRNPSEVVAAELDRVLLTDPGLDNPPAQLLPESELLERSSISLSSLAYIIQGDKGVRMMDRRWHWRLHYNCFIGFEFTTWLLQSFKDIDTREEAVEFGNELLKLGLFQHVEKRHNFRDGNYFYQISSEYRIARPESRSGWFPQKRPDKSVPSTPAGESVRDSPTSGHARSDSLEDNMSLRSSQTPLTPSKVKNKAAIMLSKSMKYDVDPRKRSYRPEVVDLHFDRLHNPDNCFHIELSWMVTTPKLIEDTVSSWALTAEKYGLKLVQVPVAEACAIPKTQPFRKPYRVSFKIKPPIGPTPTMFGTTSFAQPGPPDRLFYQKALLRKFDFVLDFEAGSAFPPDVEVSYSWGKPNYTYPQYIHRSGGLIAQITDQGDFLLLANRLASARSAVGRDTSASSRYERFDKGEQYRPRSYTVDNPLDHPSPFLSPVADSNSATITITPQGGPHSHFQPQLGASASSSSCAHNPDTTNAYRAPESLLLAIDDFCNDPVRLEQFYSEPHTLRPTSTRVGPTTASSFMESSIPSLELPASLVGSHTIPTSSPLASRVSSDAGGAGSGSVSSPSENNNSSRMARYKSDSRRGSPRTGSGSLRPLI